jgi:hypothetical protein
LKQGMMTEIRPGTFSAAMAPLAAGDAARPDGPGSGLGMA